MYIDVRNVQNDLDVVSVISCYQTDKEEATPCKVALLIMVVVRSRGFEPPLSRLADEGCVPGDPSLRLWLRYVPIQLRLPSISMSRIRLRHNMQDCGNTRYESASWSNLVVNHRL